MSKISVDAITDEAGTGAPDFPNGISATGPFTSLGIDDNATSTAITVTSAGKIGIGTGGPRANLGISDSGGADDDFNLLVTGFRPNIVLEDASSSATDYQLRADSGSLEFRSGDASTNTKLTTERMRINPAGNVGIGTASPTEKLDVAGTVKATSFSGDGSALTGVGASTTYSAVGTYGYFITTDNVASITAGSTTRSGSSLRPHAVTVYNLLASYTGNHHWPSPGSSPNVGTWRAMGGMTSAWAGGSKNTATLWVRIS